jgi:hypothetical protein
MSSKAMSMPFYSGALRRTHEDDVVRHAAFATEILAPNRGAVDGRQTDLFQLVPI